MSYKVILYYEAKADIKDAALWYNEKQNGLGKRFIASVKDEIAVIRNNPLLYEIRYDDVRTALIAAFPFLVHFQIYNNTIFIKAVYHTSRNSDIWMDR